MTRTEYLLLAEAIKQARYPVNSLAEHAANSGIERTARSIAGALALRNPYFDPVLFLKNCGVTKP